MQIIEFKSSPEFFDDECSGVKNNTARFTDDWGSARFADFNFATHIKIINSETKECFIRKIRHKCRYKNLAIITWEG